jgi:hypothetical protein
MHFVSQITLPPDEVYHVVVPGACRNCLDCLNSAGMPAASKVLTVNQV